MKLISMVDFVLENAKQPYVEGTKYKDLVNYAKFLKQYLSLGMFVPCDEDGNVLEKPEDYEKRLPNMMTEYNDEVYRYKQAKEKVLFEWFYIERGSTDVDNLTTYLIHNNFGDIAFKKDWKDEWEFIEDLESLSNLNEIELTESAIKQIGLWKH